MNESEHTPGKWQICQTTLYRGEEMIEDESGKFIASIIERETPEETTANAKLIELAPEMLDACEKAFDSFNLDDLSNFTQEQKYAIRLLGDIILKSKE